MLCPLPRGMKVSSAGWRGGTDGRSDLIRFSTRQAQVDVCEDTVVPTINAFNALEPFKAVLLAHVLMYDVVKRCKKELQRRRINV